MNRIAVVGNYLPRQCGIATFTTDLCEAMASGFPDLSVLAIPVNDTEDGYSYPPRVRFELSQADLHSYRQAADFLNINKIDAVCVQHEFGIYGGPDGSHVLSLLRELRTSIVTTLHTIPIKPSPTQRKILVEIADRSDRLVVMSRKGLGFLQDIYNVPADKVDLIPHGIHDVPFTDPNFYKDNFGVEGKFVILTFGLLSQNKGIEYVIQALPEVLETYPNVVFLVVGATHPNVQKAEGEIYRLSLQRLARRLGVENNVVFHNRFVTLEELMEYIGSADVYVTPYLNQDQITSGTLAYALGAGKAVISTPYWYAEELLGDGAGVLVPFKAADALAHAIQHVLEEEAERHAMRKQAYLLGRKMIWPEVAKEYVACLHRATEDRCARRGPRFAIKTLAEKETELPVLKLDHLRQLTDDVGLLQHAVGSVPNYWEGYSTDDNARGLVLGVLLEELGSEWLAPAAALPNRYMAFLWYAFNPQPGRFRNFMGYDRRWKEEIGSVDSHGRALWALAVVLGRSRQEGLRRAANRLFEAALPAAADFADLRPAAYTLVGLHDYLRRYPGDRAAQQARALLAERLLDAYRRNASDDWPWFEQKLSYVNAKLPHGLLVAGHWMKRPKMVEAALSALTWLAKLQTAPDGHFAPIGNEGFYHRKAERARFDQQPIEAHAMLSACLAAHDVTSDTHWKQEARRSFEWFLGRNDIGVALYEPAGGGCYDGLQREGVNTNQGAESTLSFLMSLAELRLHQQILPTVVGDPEGDGEGASVGTTSSRRRLEAAKP
ncbi:MAG: glycosyltransferase family 4 protein [Thermoguttaceae bacterium]|jgi:glycosyltransferase involved in cell wall biosynthesis|nr:glycosyltransferase family 4 protein [Thermoguttaceae bacterium]